MLIFKFTCQRIILRYLSTYFLVHDEVWKAYLPLQDSMDFLILWVRDGYTIFICIVCRTFWKMDILLKVCLKSGSSLQCRKLKLNSLWLSLPKDEIKSTSRDQAFRLVELCIWYGFDTLFNDLFYFQIIICYSWAWNGSIKIN